MCTWSSPYDLASLDGVWKLDATLGQLGMDGMVVLAIGSYLGSSHLELVECQLGLFQVCTWVQWGPIASGQHG